MNPDTESAVREHMRYWCKKGEPSPAALRCAELLHLWQGLHHLDSAEMARADWTNPRYVSVKLDTHMSSGQLSTWDFNSMTELVFLAHDLCIRVDVHPASARFYHLIMHPRDSREGGMSARHPTIEQAVRSWRERHASEAVDPGPDRLESELEAAADWIERVALPALGDDADGGNALLASLQQSLASWRDREPAGERGSS